MTSPIHCLLGISLLASTTLAAGGSGPIGETCVTDEIVLATTNWVDMFEFPQFDPSTGFLQEIKVTFAGHVEGEANVESTDNQPVVVSIDYGAEILLKTPGGADLLFLSPTTNIMNPLSAFDGTIDFGGTSGVSNTDIVLQEVGMSTTPPGPLNLADFIGTGTVQMEVTADGVSSAAGSGNIISQFLTSASASIEVCYRFVPDCNGNGIPDDIDVDGSGKTGGTSDDCNENGIPDECEPDCDEDGIPDDCEPDSNQNGIPDDCDAPPNVDLGCSEFDRYENLTPNDTLTLITTVHNPEHAQGFAIVTATRNNENIGFDYLIGQTMIISGIDVLEYAVNSMDYRAAVAHGAATDVDSDGIRDLNGEEYEMTPAELHIPRFLGQNPHFQVGPGPMSLPRTNGQLILIGLSGGTRFETTVDFLISNDNEQIFSAEYTFECWDKVSLLDITGTFGNSFLANASGDDPEEQVGSLEAGWFRMFGAAASSTAYQIENPAIYGMYIEIVNHLGAADLPFERGARAGHLLPRALFGDNDEADGSDPAQDLDAIIQRRRPASLLLYPEFDNRVGDVSVFTVTNTHPSEDIRAHFVYYGKYGAQQN